MGAAEFCMYAGQSYSLERIQFGRPLTNTQFYQKKLANMMTDISLGLQRALAVERLVDKAQAASEILSIVKGNNCDQTLALDGDIHGVKGINEEYQIMRYAINLETVNTYESAHDVNALILGRAIIGLAAF